ncbi:MFS transporter [Variovorax sp. H27-G14]|uniref:MFS transporter n=1 Tax=Variovorax sp. H27-G14 TaxID=3111914 RepID=UPI0038FC4C2B
MQHKPNEAWNSRARLTAATLGLAIFLAQFDVTSVVVAMPMIGADLGIRDAAIAWIIDAYSIAFTATLLIAGALADRFGRRCTLLIGNAWFLLASLCCGLGWDTSTFLASRALQGGGAAFLVTGAISSIATAFPDAQARARAFGLVGVISGIAMALGPSLGGAISMWLGWRWIFLVNLPICVLVAFAVTRFVPESLGNRGKPLDWPSVVMLTLALGLVIEALLQARHSWTRFVFGLAVGVGLLVLFTLRQRKQERPMLDPAVFASRSMIGVAALIAAVSIGYWAVLVYLPLFLNTAYGWTLQEAGMGLLAATLPMLIVPPFSGRVAAQLGWRCLFAIALTTMAIGGIALGLAAAQTTSSVMWSIAGMVILGTGAALASPQLSGAVLALAPPEASGMASAIAVIARQGGFAIGVAALGGLLPSSGAVSGFVWPFCVAAAASASGALACLLLPPASGKSSQQELQGQSLASGKQQPQRDFQGH